MVFFRQIPKNALIELIYALHANSSLSHGKIGIRKISLILEKLFQITLGDLHNSFHRMKTRAGSRTTFTKRGSLQILSIIIYFPVDRMI